MTGGLLVIPWGENIPCQRQRLPLAYLRCISQHHQPKQLYLNEISTIFHLVHPYLSQPSRFFAWKAHLNLAWFLLKGNVNVCVDDSDRAVAPFYVQWLPTCFSFFVDPKSDHCLALSLSHSVSQSLHFHKKKPLTLPPSFWTYKLQTFWRRFKKHVNICCDKNKSFGADQDGRSCAKPRRAIAEKFGLGRKYAIYTK